MDEGDALGKFLIAVDHRGLRDAPGGIFVQAFDDERESQTRRTANLAPEREYGKGRQRDAVVDKKLLR